jgi:membrane dipeptidase
MASFNYIRKVPSIDFGLSPEQEQRAKELHQRIFVFDSLMECCWYEEFVDNCFTGGGNGGNLSLGITGMHDFPQAKTSTKENWWSWRALVNDLASFPEIVRQHGDRVMQCNSAADLRAAQAQGKLGLMLGTQNTVFMDRDIDRLNLAYNMGLRIAQVTYNSTNFLGSGCMEKSGSQFGLSALGESAVARMNELGILVDTGHSSTPTLKAAIEVSSTPIACTHAGVRALVDQPRSHTDEALTFLADNGGVFGVVSTPQALNGQARCTVHDYLDSIEYAINLMGIDHVGFGTDFAIPSSLEQVLSAPEWSREIVERVGDFDQVWPWSDGHQGMENNAGYPNLTRGLVARGYSDEDIAKVMGGNWLRLIEETVG